MIRESGIVPGYSDASRSSKLLSHLSRKAVLVVLVVVAAVIAIAIGVGVGIGVNRNPAKPVAPSVAGTNLTATTTTTVASSVPTPLKHGIVNDSSLAAVIDSSDARHLFFQDINGTIRQATRSPSSPAVWGSPLDVVVVSDAKAYTPLAAILRRNSGFLSDANEVSSLSSCSSPYILQPKTTLTYSI